jgi:hypothetical protein
VTSEGPSLGERAALALAIAAAVDAVPGVRRSGGGTSVPMATQFAGGSVLGVHLEPDRIEVHVTAERLPLRELADELHATLDAALALAGDARPYQLVIDDLDVRTL